MGLDNITKVIQKAERLFAKVESGVNWSERLFDPSVWKPLEKMVTSWQISNDPLE